MKFTKKLLSLLLAIAMLFTITVGIDLSANAAVSGSQIVSYARQFIGYPYVYGTQGPNSFDCSGFVQYVFKHFGISLPASSSSYWTYPTNYGTVVGTESTANAVAGDIISWSGHVAIYTENGRCVEALNPKYGVTESVPVNSHTNGKNYKVIRINGVTSTPVSENIGDNFYAYVIKLDSWKHIENNGGNVRLSYSNDIYSPKQIWHFIRQADNSYKIVNEYDNYCLDVYGMGTDNGTNVITYFDKNVVNQKWNIFYDGTGGFNIFPYYCNKALDVNGGTNNGGENIQLWDYNNGNAQKFSIYNVEKCNVSYSKPSKPEKVAINYKNSEKNVSISWSESKVYSKYDNRTYNVSIYKEDGALIYSNSGLTNRNINITIPSYGTYKVSVTAINTKYPNYNSVSESYMNFAEHKHTYSNNGTIMEAATCTSNGYKVYTCRECSAIKTEAIPATGHSYDTGKITKQPTATTAGVKTYTCTKCKATKTEAIKATSLKSPILKATVNANGTFKLSWNKVAGAEKYELYIKNADGSYKLMKTTTGTSFTTAVAAYGKQYTYKMKAVKGSTKSAYSSAVNAKNTKKLQAPTAKVTVNANGSFKISWNKVAGATKYGIYMKQANGSYKWIKTVTGTSWSTAVAAYGKQYSYKVLAANNNKSVQTFGNVVNAKNTKKLQTPSLKVAVNKNGSFKLTWGKVTGAEKYELYIRQANGSYKLMKTTTGTSFTTAVAAKGKTYSYKIRAVTSKNKNATSNYSKVVSVKRK